MLAHIYCMLHVNCACAIAFAVALSLVASPVHAVMPSAPYLVKEINTKTTIGTNPSHMTAVGDELFFETDSPQAIWKTDGTAAGTVPVEGVPRLRQPIAFRDALIFGTSKGLWTSDGTAAGTRLIAPIKTGETETGSSAITRQGDTLFVIGRAPDSTSGLWRSDGTPEGTMLVKALEGSAHQITTVRGMLVLLHGRGLWTSDGTAEGTRRIVLPGTDVSSFDLGSLTSIGDLAFFTSCGRHRKPCQLWRTDGTDDGTFAVATLVEDYDEDNDGDPSFYTRVLQTAAANGTLFVCTHENDLWASDGTVEGTRRLRSAQCPNSRRPAELARVGGVLIFSSHGGVWRSDGTPEGTGRLLDLEPGSAGLNVQVLGQTSEAAFFTASTLGGGTELWRTDGTPAGTVAVSPVPTTVGFVWSDDDDLLPAVGALGETLFFAGCTGAIGCELWKSDGTAQGTGLVRDITPNWPSASSSPRNLVDVGGTLYFKAFDPPPDSGYFLTWFEPTRDLEIWRSDGTEEGTSLVADLEPGVDDNPQLKYLTDAAGTLYFTKSEGHYYYTPYNYSVSSSLWKSDGTPAGTVRIFGPDTDPGWQARALAHAGGMVFFQGPKEGSEYPLWRSDGTTEGTIRLTSVQPYYLTGVGGTAFFAASDGETGFELWASDGTPEGTARVADINPSGNALEVWRWKPSDPPPRGLLVPGDGVVYFPAYQGASGCQVWRSDGTEAGTVRLTARAGAGCPSRLTPVDGAVFFVHSSGLWRTDGSSSGAVRLAPYSSRSSVSTSLPVVGNTVFFTVCSESLCELWRSDGTPDGTHLVFAPGAESGSVSEPMQVGDTIVFWTWDPQRRGSVLWQSDGTDSGTEPVLFIPSDGDPEGWTLVGGRLYFTQEDAQHGRELWAINLAASENQPEPTTTSTTTSTTTTTTTTTTLPGQCTNKPNGSRCDDGNACSSNDRCMDGYCVAGPPTDCDDGDNCTDDACDPWIGCISSPNSTNCNDGAEGENPDDDLGDTDNDGVVNYLDRCAGTPVGDLVGGDGCSICDCEKMPDGNQWSFRGAYGRCIKSEVKRRRVMNLLTRKEMRAALKRAKKSTCGTGDLTRCCVYPRIDKAREPNVGRCRIMPWKRCARKIKRYGDAEDLGTGSCLPNPCMY